MKVYDFNTLLESKEKKDTKMAIAIGVFDGVHKGHKKIFETLKETGDADPSVETMCITFSTNRKCKNAQNLDTMRLREEYVSSFSINSFTIIDFSENFSKISACGFLDSIRSLCRPKVLVLGSDFKCGNPSQSADGDEMIRIFSQMGEDVLLKKVDFVLSENGEKISSTLLRKLIINGDLESYSRLSGDSYRLDLMTEPSRENGCITFRREQISQILPPPGDYEGELLDLSLEKEDVLVCLDSSRLRLYCSDSSKQIDSLFFTRRR